METRAEAFINPYAFVPLPPKVIRQAPTYHQGQNEGEQLYSGSFTVSWKTASPLLLPKAAEAEGWIRGDGSISIPGSSLKGVIRSLHEAMFNGCFRIVDEEFVPGYRMPAVVPTDRHDWVLARVHAADAGFPTAFQPCEQNTHVWVDAEDLKRSFNGDLPSTGDICVLEGTTRYATYGQDPNSGRFEWESIRRAERRPEQARVTTELPQGRVVLVTDVGARRPRRRDGSPGRALWATAELGAQTVPFDLDAATDARAWREFRAACAGTNDRRELELGSDASWRRQRVFADVIWHGRPIARRTRQTGFLFEGDVVWLKLNGGRLEGIRLSQIWRESGKGPVSARLGGSGPCTRTDQLCLSCAVFGSADTCGDEGGRGRQDSYAGHVRFTSAVTAHAVSLATVHLAPMGNPKPGAGGFYLRLNAGAHSSLDSDVLAHWGSTADIPLAPINGRKFYWHSNPDQEVDDLQSIDARCGTPRYQHIPSGRENKMAREKALLVPKDVEFKARITFDRLDRVGVDSLLAAIDPQRTLTLLPGHEGDGPMAVRLGGGKPFGLGSAVVSLTDVTVWQVTSRYVDPGGDPVPWPPRLDPEDARRIVARVGPFSTALRALHALLPLHSRGDAERLVTYPPGAAWSEFGTEQFRHSYEFFQETNGQGLTRQRRPFVILPVAVDDPRLPIYTKADRRDRR